MADRSRRLEGKRILVTGAAGGIGDQIVRRLASEGASVAASDLAASLDQGSPPPAGTINVPGDLSSRESVEQLVAQACNALGGIDGLVHSAAIGSPTSFLDCPIELWDRVIAINLTATFDLLRLVGRRLAENGGGSMVALASVAGMRANPGNCPYAASKAGLIGLVKAAAVDLGWRGVRVNVLVPGPTDTPLMRGIVGAGADRLGQNTMLGRLGLPEETAAAAAFLVSDDASYTTGTVFCADGGASTLGFRAD